MYRGLETGRFVGAGFGDVGRYPGRREETRMMKHEPSQCLLDSGPPPPVPSPVSGDCAGTPYCTARDLLRYHDAEQVAYLLGAKSVETGRDWVALAAPQNLALLDAKLRQVGFCTVPKNIATPSYMAMVTPRRPAGERLLKLGLAVTGRIDSACLAGGVYRPEHLRALTGAFQERLRKLAADLWFLGCVEQWGLERIEPEAIPVASNALADLNRLEKGDYLFGIPEPRATRWEGVVVIHGRGLSLTPQLAQLLELGLVPSGTPFDEVRKQLLLESETTSGIRARVEKLKHALERETKQTPFRITVTTVGERVSASVVQKA